MGHGSARRARQETKIRNRYRPLALVGDVRLRYGAGSRLCCKDDLDKSINVTPRCQTMSPRIIHLPLSGRDRRHYVRELRDRLFEILWRLRPGGYLLRCFVNIRMT